MLSQANITTTTEFIAIADPWLTAHQQAPPVLEGQLLQYIGAPNRYGLPGLFELHVWAWRDNPLSPPLRCCHTRRMSTMISARIPNDLVSGMDALGPRSAVIVLALRAYLRKHKAVVTPKEVVQG